VLPRRCGLLDLSVSGESSCVIRLAGLTASMEQRWIYRVDPKRVNEYGQVLKEEKEKEKDE
jgi:hypothetical protein